MEWKLKEGSATSSHIGRAAASETIGEWATKEGTATTRRSNGASRGAGFAGATAASG